MQSGRLLAVIGLIAPLTLPTDVLAQGSSGLQIFGAYNNSVPGGTGMTGIGLTMGAGPLALRGTFGVSLSSFTTTSSINPPSNFGRWNGDADLILADSFLGLGSLLGGVLHPYGFAGIGAQSSTDSPTIADAVKTWSYGGGVSVPLSASISIDGEMRNRSLLGATVVSPTDFVSGTEFRVGLEYRFGASRRGRVARGSTTSRPTSPASTVAASGAARRVVPAGERYLGVPYVWGGSTPQGFDCSGFVQYVYAREGVDLPRTSRQMAGSGFAVDVSPRTMAVGDLMLFADGGPISHVAIYAGNGRFIHSSASGNGVRYDDLNSQRGRWYAENLVAVRRVATGSGAVVAAFAKSFIKFEGFDPPDLAPPVKK